MLGSKYKDRIRPYWNYTKDPFQGTKIKNAKATINDLYAAIYWEIFVDWVVDGVVLNVDGVSSTKLILGWSSSAGKWNVSGKLLTGLK